MQTPLPLKGMRGSGLWRVWLVVGALGDRDRPGRVLGSRPTAPRRQFHQRLRVQPPRHRRPDRPPPPAGLLARPHVHRQHLHRRVLDSGEAARARHDLQSARRTRRPTGRRRCFVGGDPVVPTTGRSSTTAGTSTAPLKPFPRRPADGRGELEVDDAPAPDRHLVGLRRPVQRPAHGDGAAVPGRERQPARQLPGLLGRQDPLYDNQKNTAYSVNGALPEGLPRGDAGAHARRPLPADDDRRSRSSSPRAASTRATRTSSTPGTRAVSPRS